MCAAGVAGILTVGIMVLAGSSNPAYAQPSAPSCQAARNGIGLHYQVAQGPYPGEVGTDAGVEGVTVSGLSAGCDGHVVTLVLWGNDEGDPSEPGDLLLATAVSDRDPCTGALLPRPIGVAAGSIELGFCRTGGPAGYADLRELTRVVVTVDGVELSSPTPSVGQATGAMSTPGGPGSVGSNRTAGLAFSGSYAVYALLVGFGSVAAGSVIVLRARRRDGREEGSGPSGLV